MANAPLTKQQLYTLIQSGDSEGVRRLLLEAPQLTSTKERFPALLFDKSVERDAYKFLGAYLGKSFYPID